VLTEDLSHLTIIEQRKRENIRILSIQEPIPAISDHTGFPDTTDLPLKKFKRSIECGKSNVDGTS
jgi:hypothetical protein